MTTSNEPRVFTRDAPCTKVDIWNCFIDRKAPRAATFRRVPVVEAGTYIGNNTPKYLLKKAYASMETQRGVEYYYLTTEGQQWLIAGTERQLELYPTLRGECIRPPGGSDKYPILAGKRNDQRRHTTLLIRRK